MSKIIVVGANHAGTAAIRTLLSNYPEHEVVVYDQNNNISFLGCGMALWIGNQISKPDGLFYATKESLEQMGAKIHMEAAVNHIDFANKKLSATLKDGSTVEDFYDKIILATGSLPIIPNIPGKDLENVQQVKLYQNAQEVIEKIKTAVITDKKEIPADMVVLSIGFRPNNALGKDSLELFRNGSYLVNKKQETSMKDVYAIGDCATVFDNTIDNTNYIALASNALRSGIVAAHNAAGHELESVGVQGSNGICIYDLKMVSTGITVSKAQKLGLDVEYTDFNDTQKPGFIETENPSVKIRIVYDKKTRVVLGAQMASKYDMSMGIHMFSLAIQEKVTIDKLSLLDIFFLPHFNQPYNYITMASLSAK